MSTAETNISHMPGQVRPNQEAPGQSQFSSTHLPSFNRYFFVQEKVAGGKLQELEHVFELACVEGGFVQT